MNSQERADLIESRKTRTERTVREWCKDQWVTFAIHRVPTDALLLNVDNRRFAAERTYFEERMGRPLDAESNPDDERSIVSILLDVAPDVDDNVIVGSTPKKDYEALKKDWERRNQEAPFWIRPDGVVRNGNRRLAMLRRMRQEGGREGTEGVDAIILPYDEYDEHDVFEMEQREQLTEDFKVRYTDINLLLSLRDAANDLGVDWADATSLDNAAGALQHLVKGSDKAYALIQLNAIRYMDLYLLDLNASGQYHKLLRQVERFRDVGKIMSRMEEQHPDDAPDMLRVAFAAIRAGSSHGQIRKFRNIFLEDAERWRALVAEVDQEEERWREENEPAINSPDPAILTDSVDEEDENGDVPAPVSPGYPTKRVISIIRNSIDAHDANESSAEDMLEQACNRLEDLIRPSDDRLRTVLAGEESARVRTLLERIFSWVERVKSY